MSGTTNVTPMPNTGLLGRGTISCTEVKLIERLYCRYLLFILRKATFPFPLRSWLLIEDLSIRGAVYLTGLCIDQKLVVEPPLSADP